jgi:hypothetical protein
LSWSIVSPCPEVLSLFHDLRRELLGAQGFKKNVEHNKSDRTGTASAGDAGGGGSDGADGGKAGQTIIAMSYDSI